MRVDGKDYRPVWLDGRVVRMIDQRQLPHRFVIVDCSTYQQTAEAIRNMTTRGAGAIGVAAGFAMAQAALDAADPSFPAAMRQAAAQVRATRPTARDLFHAVEQVEQAVAGASGITAARQAAVARAHALADENADAGRRIGEAGEPLIGQGARIMTQCNAGWLAFADWGSALAPVYAAHRNGKRPFVYVPETRPRAQGAKLTAWELGQEGVAHSVIADGARGFFLQRGTVDLVIVGADRIALNGDTANKIGTYPLALLARHHGVPFYVAAPRSTFDGQTPDGALIVIEERDEEEVLCVEGLAEDGTLRKVRVAPATTSARNPAFDVTPADLITGFITDAGVLPATPGSVARLLGVSGARTS